AKISVSPQSPHHLCCRPCWHIAITGVKTPPSPSADACRLLKGTTSPQAQAQGLALDSLDFVNRNDQNSPCDRHPSHLEGSHSRTEEDEDEPMPPPTHTTQFTTRVFPPRSLRMSLQVEGPFATITAPTDDAPRSPYSRVWYPCLIRIHCISSSPSFTSSHPLFPLGRYLLNTRTHIIGT
ncbi:hypothetical protein BC826DRAFT_1059163, partial [Russula brevipes]